MKLRSSETPKRKSALLRFMMAAVMLGVVALLLEVCAFPVYWFIFKKPLNRTDIQRRLAASTPPLAEDTKAIVADPNRPADLMIRNHILHPYFGFVGRPGTYDSDPEFFRNGQPATINELGFLGPSPLLAGPTNSVNIGVFGGSFAANFYLDSRETLASELKKNDFFKNKPLNITSVAMTGWKQPQQVMALAYLLAQNAQFDVVVNLDGFNEMFLTTGENANARIFPLYPRSWTAFASRGALPEPVLAKLAELAILKQQSQARRRLFGSALLRQSNFCLLLFEVLNQRMENQTMRGRWELQALMKEGGPEHTVENSGPKARFTTGDQYLTAMADFWARCSREMNELCRAENIAYLHFLQPNQYVPDSKPMGPTERQVAWSDTPEPRESVQLGYPYLVRASHDFTKSGEYFVDLTMVFKEVTEPLYEDNCCHINKRGNDLIAARIAEEIAAAQPFISTPAK